MSKSFRTARPRVPLTHPMFVILFYSKEGKGLLLTQMSIIAWLPIQDLVSGADGRLEELNTIAETRIAQALEKDSVPGLKEQYELMMETFKSPQESEVELIAVPFHFPSTIGTSNLCFRVIKL